VNRHTNVGWQSTLGYHAQPVMSMMT
jgi:hypothetical protein